MTIDETNFKMFAPNLDALNEAEEIIKTLLDQPVGLGKKIN